MTIWKYALELTGGNVWNLTLPAGYRLLSVLVQNEKLFLCALVDSEERQMVRVKVRCFGTGSGNEVPVLHDHPYLGTVQLYNGSLVLHFFCLTDAEGVLIP